MIDNDSIITLENRNHSIKPEDGALLLIDKPLDWTSFDVVNKLRFALKHKLGLKKIKVGHAGTLDPRATGLLLICIGKFTKEINELTDKEKCYRAEVTFGAETLSYDAECEPINLKNTQDLTVSQIVDLESQFIGNQDQIPPIYSAIKISGQAAYKLARRGEEIEMKPRPIVIYSLKFSEVELPKATFDVCCSKGTYIRSLAHDMGQKLGYGAYLSGLVRTSIGSYQLSDALSLDQALAWIDCL